VTLLFPRPAFYLYAALKISSGLLMLTMNLEFKAPATDIVSHIKSVINIEIVVLFFITFVLGWWTELNSTLYSVPDSHKTHILHCQHNSSNISAEIAIAERTERNIQRNDTDKYEK
jgi:hypothetical protein